MLPACPDHPKYQGASPPTWDCPHCWRIRDESMRAMVQRLKARLKRIRDISTA